MSAHPELVQHLLEHSVRTGDFTLKSGKKSNWFIDAKQTACRADGILLVADAALSIMPDDITAIGGLTAGADPVAFGIAAALLMLAAAQLRASSAARSGEDAPAISN